MTRVALLWHQHQPFYQDLVTGEHILPWVRLHALKDYYGMAAILREFPGVRVTINLVPSLLVQIEAFAEDAARDPYLHLSLKPAADLTPSEIEFVTANFFHAQRQRMIDVHPRYAELLAERRRLGVDDLRDLQVWHKLAWVDPLYFETDARVRRLAEQGRNFTEDDKLTLRDVELEILRRVIPEHRELAARGQVELSASPFYHPILPLLCDTDIYLTTHPDARRPRRPFVHPEDAAEQLARAVACHERLFGIRPRGLWPSEGSVSDAMVPLVAGAGFEWMATDELILARTMSATFSRDGFGNVEQPERLYAAYRVEARGASVACVFRDHVLSDLIGFTYAGWPADRAADDFVSRLVEAGRRFAARAEGEPVIPVILDGENAWEHFEGGGRPFLRALYRRLSDHPELTTVTMSEASATATRTLPGIFPGSWIDANFSIWIGHPDDQKAWSQLADARAALDEAAAEGAPDLEAAREEILIAEGSDWCWWYGDDHSSAHDAEFDDLFRRHLRNAYGFMGRPAPDELYISNISTGGPQSVQTEATGLLTPTLDGEETSYFEWVHAGSLEAGEAVGAMHQVDRRPPVLTLIRFGFDAAYLFIRIDAVKPLVDVLAEGHEVSVKFLAPEGVRYSVRAVDGRVIGNFWDWQSRAQAWSERGPDGAAAAAATILELALPLRALDARPGQRIAFVAAVYDGSTELERHPGQRAIELTVPDALFEARAWQA